jgi:uncharacterized protein YggE
MKNLFLAVSLQILLSLPFQSQVLNPSEETPYIEVVGKAELEIVPDEIYIAITLKEEYDNKEKITIEQKEEKLIKALKNIGINVTDLALSSTNAGTIKVQWKRKDVLTQKDYSLKVADAITVGKVFQELDKIEIKNAYIFKVDHSKIDSLRRENRINAIKAAKTKADYLLNAIGEQTGKAIVVREELSDLNTGNQYRVNQLLNYSNTSSTENMYDKIGSNEIEFQKIKVSSSVYVKFQIK